ncbi:hypothetical protein JIR001_18950 [Polycladomyces abyssicola]|uniref:Uncharacterized protein n=1 Tax=Polycladomyces abyssicola TaxID=1125966 RepID=A0A8D5ZNM9_9BACL|nr:hypothetical protein [Polycladomyces abyssicola]BCU82112.1 hypothetical protein JIR001_18950 [Polycladomyces abyssicola]
MAIQRRLTGKMKVNTVLSKDLSTYSQNGMALRKELGGHTSTLRDGLCKTKQWSQKSVFIGFEKSLYAVRDSIQFE